MNRPIETRHTASDPRTLLHTDTPIPSPSVRITMTSSPYKPRTQAIGLGLSLIAVIIAAAIGNLATGRAVDTWYLQLQAPPLTPPGWIFAPAWTLLYALMAVSAWLVWRSEPWPEPRTALAVYAAQLAVNASWSLVFFGARAPGLAVIIILVLIALIVATMIRFHKHAPLATWLFAPYLGWVLFATYLNVGFRLLN